MLVYDAVLYRRFKVGTQTEKMGRSDAMSAGMPRQPRTSRLLTAQLMSPRLGSAKIVVRNISAGGLGGKCDQNLHESEEVAVLLPNVGAVDATIVWVKDKTFGLQFHQGIDPGRALAEQTERAVKPYEVPSYFRPEISTYRPGFGQKGRLSNKG